MSILYSILGFIAFSLFSVIVFPILGVIFFVAVAGLVARLGSWKMSSEISPELVALLWKKRLKGFDDFSSPWTFRTQVTPWTKASALLSAMAVVGKNKERSRVL